MMKGVGLRKLKGIFKKKKFINNHGQFLPSDVKFTYSPKTHYDYDGVENDPAAPPPSIASASSNNSQQKHEEEIMATTFPPQHSDLQTTQLVPYKNTGVTSLDNRMSHPDYTASISKPPVYDVPQPHVKRKRVPTPPKYLYDDIIELLNKAGNPKHATTAAGARPLELNTQESLVAARFLICLGMLIAYPMAGTLLFVMLFGLELFLNNRPLDLEGIRKPL